MTPKPTRKPSPRSASKAPAAPDGDEIDSAKFPNLAAERDWDRAQHIKQAIAAGMTKKQAERHADAELHDG